MADKVKDAGVDVIDLKGGKASVRAQIEKRKEKIDYFIAEKKKFDAVSKK